MGFFVSCVQNAGQSDIFNQTKKANDSSLEGHVSQDVDQITAVYSDESILMPPGSEPIAGLENIREYYQKGFNSGKVLEVSTQNISYRVIDENHTEEVGSYQMKYLVKGEKVPITVEGHMIITWSKNAEGDWKIIYDMWH